MSDREQERPRLMNVGGVLIGPTPEPPGHLLDMDTAAADAAWRQSNGSIAAYHMLCEEHANGVINLLSGNPMRLTGPDAPEIAGGDKRFSATGGEVAGNDTGQTPVLPLATGPQPSPRPNADQVSPLSEDERNMLADLRAKPEAELSAGEAANLRALEDREEALSSADNQRPLRPLTNRMRERLAAIRDIAEGSRTPQENAELAALEARENIER
jgi:hypothetical protein